MYLDRCGGLAVVLTQVTELPAVFERVGVLHTDGECCRVHVGAVCQGHLVSALVRGDVWTFLVRVVVTVVVAVTQVGLGYTAAVVTCELVWSTATRDLVAPVPTVVVAITHVCIRYAAAVGAGELMVETGPGGTAHLVTAVLTVTVTVTLPCAGDTLTCGTLELVDLTRLGRAVSLVAVV